MNEMTTRVLAYATRIILVGVMLAFAAPAAASSGPVEKQAEATPAACNDGVDNDNDGDIDYPNDADCDALADTAEGTEGPPQCNDGADNDSDGDIDYPNDGDCEALADGSEAGADGGTAEPAPPQPRPDRATKVNSSVSIRFDPRYGFRGQTSSPRQLCERKRTVTLRYVDAGPDTKLGAAETRNQGKWGVPIFRPGARHYAIVARKVVKAGSGEQVVCLGGRSKTFGPI